MRTLRISELLPSGFVVENVTIFAERVSVEVRASAESQMCSLCGGHHAVFMAVMGVGY